MFLNDFVFTIVGLYRDNLKQIYSISDIAQKTGKKYPFVHKKVMELVSVGVLRSLNFGRAHLCALAIEHPMAQLCLGIIHTQQQPLWSEEFVGFLRRICQRGSARTVVFDGKSTVYVASHAEDQIDQQQTSSLQVFFTKEEKTKHIRVNSMNYDAFISLLLDDEKLYASHVVIQNTQLFCELILAQNMTFEQKYSPLYARGETR